MIVCKYAVNSLDIHFIHAKSLDLHQLFTGLADKSRAYLNDKGEILSEFEEIEGVGKDNEVNEAITQTRMRYLEIESEMGNWMQMKAEPNLIEVERKSFKYKIKWESLKIHDKKAKLKAMAQKRQIIAAGIKNQ